MAQTLGLLRNRPPPGGEQAVTVAAVAVAGALTKPLPGPAGPATAPLGPPPVTQPLCSPTPSVKWENRVPLTVGGGGYTR